MLSVHYACVKYKTKAILIGSLLAVQASGIPDNTGTYSAPRHDNYVYDYQNFKYQDLHLIEDGLNYNYWYFTPMDFDTVIRKKPRPHSRERRVGPYPPRVPNKPVSVPDASGWSLIAIAILSLFGAKAWIGRAK